jgi:hypothetical protein
VSRRTATAAALALAFLDTDWHDPGELATRAGAALSLPATRVWPLAVDVLRVYRRAPRDRPRELAAYVESTVAFDRLWRKSLRRRHGRPVVREWPLPTVAMGRSRWPARSLDTVGDLARWLGLSAGELAWFADVRSLERRDADERLRHYRYAWRRTRRGGLRLLEAPKPRLRDLQRRLLDESLGLLPPHPAAHGFVTGRSPVTFAAAHVDRDVVVHADLEAFFPSVTAGRIFGIWRSAGYAEPVAHVLTGLTTNVVPLPVRRNAPQALRDEDVDTRRRLLVRVGAPHLPAGAPTSPALANLAAWRLDVRLSGLADGAGASYTRYADDLALSLSGRGAHACARRLLGTVSEIARDEGFRLNPHKSVIATRAQRQVLAGVVVNAKPSVPRDEVDRLRALLHNCRSHGPDSQNRDGHADFRAHVLGRLSWVAAVDPRRGAALRAMADAVDW